LAENSVRTAGAIHKVSASAILGHSCVDAHVDLARIIAVANTGVAAILCRARTDRNVRTDATAVGDVAANVNRAGIIVVAVAIKFAAIDKAGADLSMRTDTAAVGGISADVDGTCVIVVAVVVESAIYR